MSDSRQGAPEVFAPALTMIAAAALLLMATDARALQIAVQGPDPRVTIDVMECANCSLLLRFTVVNTGAPVDATVTLSTMSARATPDRYDTDNDVLQAVGTTQGDPTQCARRLAATMRCSVYAEFSVRDADPFDTQDRGDVPGLWTATFGFRWAIPSVGVQGLVSMPVSVNVTDQRAPAPEPRTWALMLLGLGLAGAGLRRRSPRLR